MRISDAIDTLGEPYPGLRPFRHDETLIFFGRENTIDDMVERLAAHHFLAVTGLSGSGKSSLVRTGLINALDRGLLIGASSLWSVADFRPGAQPFSRLAEALLVATGGDVSPENCALTEAKLARGPLGLAEWLDEIGLPTRTNLLVLVDQFEEIFRYRDARAGDAINAFVALLIASAQYAQRPIYVVITMRSDFLGECAQFTDLAEMINLGQFLTPRLTRDQCRQAIEEPARVYGGSVEDVLVTRLLNDIGGNPDQLPLLQHVLMRLWQDARASANGHPPLLTLADYERLGGIGESGPDAGTSTDAAREVSHGALSDHADRVLASLSSEQQQLAEILFRALTESEGAGGRDVRRPITLATAAAIAQVPIERLVPIVEAFRAPGVTFLTPLAPEPLGPDTIIDISHESLIRQWVKLRGWVRDEYQSAETYRGLERSAKRWKHGLGNLYSKIDLAVARQWRATERHNAAWAERYGDAYDLAMEFLRRSQRSRLRHRGLAAAAICIPVAAIAAVIWFMFYQITVVVVALAYANPGGEFTEFDVEPQAVLKQDKIGSETPTTIPGGQIVRTLELKAALDSGKLHGAPFVVIDALAPKHELLVPKAQHVEYAGDAGSFQDATQAKLADKLKELTGNNLDMGLVFYCAGSNCWESYNACLRAIYLGYTHVYWYRGGILAWRDADVSVAQRMAEALKTKDLSLLPMQNSTVISMIPREIALIKSRLLPSAEDGETTNPKVAGSDCAKTDAACYHKRGLASMNKSAGDDDVAIANFSAAVAIDPNNADYRYSRASSYAHKADYDNAIADFTRAIALNSDQASYYHGRAVAFQKKSDYDDALADYVKSAALDPAYTKDVDAKIRQPEFSAVYRRRGDDDYKASKYAAAIESFTKAIELNPKDATAYRGRGKAFTKLDDLNRAIGDYRKAIEVAKGDDDRASLQSLAGDLGGIAWQFVLAREFAKGLEASDQAIALAPNKIWLYVNRAHALMFLGRIDEARAIYLEYRGRQKVVGEDSWDTILRNDFADLRTASLSDPLMDAIEKQLSAP